jgi:hypothetical protein
MGPLRATFNLALAFGVGFFGGLLIQRCEALGQARGDPVPWQRQQPRNTAQCWHQPDGANSTILCQNGYWRTITPEGQEYTGMGVQDPNMQSIGGNFVINKASGGPNTNIMTAPVVTPPGQTQPTVGPGANELYGNQPRY